MYEEISSNIEGNDFSTLDPNNLTYTTTVVKETLRIQVKMFIVDLYIILEISAITIWVKSYTITQLAWQPLGGILTIYWL